MKLDKLLPFILIVAILIVLPLTLYLTRQEQDIRQKAAPATTLSLSPQNSTVAPGQPFPVNVVLNAGDPTAGGNIIVGAELHMTYDADKLTVKSVTLPTIPVLPTLDIADTSVPGKIDVYLLSDVGLAAATPQPGVTIGELVTIIFEAQSETPLTSIAFTEETEIAAIGGDQGKNVLSGPPTGASIVVISPSPTPVPTPAPSPDMTPPTVSITAPAAGTMVAGTVPINATATDNIGVEKVEFYVDGTLKGTDTTSPYSYDWDTTNAGAHPCIGAHTHSLTVRAYDVATNNATTAPLVVNMNNPPYCASPTPTPVASPSPTPTPVPTPEPTPDPTPEPTPVLTTINILTESIDTPRTDVADHQIFNFDFIKTGTTARIDISGVVMKAGTGGVFANTGVINHPSLTPGTYDIYVSGPSHLTHKFTAVSVSGGSNTLDLTSQKLIVGDIVDNNSIDQPDYNALISSFGCRRDRPTPPPGKTCNIPYRADLDLDGRVSIHDYAYLVVNYTKSGVIIP